ncbi:MAG: DUF423 domain-containing protein [Rhodospirillales bacterium]
MNAKWWIVLAGISGALAVALGAYGAHGLDGDEVLKRQFDTANRYHMWHSLALLGVALLAERGGLWAHAAAGLFTLGMVLFSGALYAATAAGFWGLTFLAPWGGTALMAGWLALIGAALPRKT